MRRELARRRQERRETRWQRRWHVSPRLHLHPHYSVSILDDSSHGNGLQAAINRAIAGRWSDYFEHCLIRAVSVRQGDHKSVQSLSVMLMLDLHVERSSSAVKCWPLNRESPGLNPLCCCFEAWAFSFSTRSPSSLSCINEYLAIDSGGHVSE